MNTAKRLIEKKLKEDYSIQLQKDMITNPVRVLNDIERAVRSAMSSKDLDSAKEKPYNQIHSKIFDCIEIMKKVF